MGNRPIPIKTVYDGMAAALLTKWPTMKVYGHNPQVELDQDPPIAVMSVRAEPRLMPSARMVQTAMTVELVITLEATAGTDPVAQVDAAANDLWEAVRDYGWRAAGMNVPELTSLGGEDPAPDERVVWLRATFTCLCVAVS